MSKVILQKIQLENFKCYQKTTILFKDLGSVTTNR